jgi:hypothetical protein
MPLGRFMCRWKWILQWIFKTQECDDVNWIHLTQNQDLWLTLESMVINLRVPYRYSCFLDQLRDYLLLMRDSKKYETVSKSKEGTKVKLPCGENQNGFIIWNKKKADINKYEHYSVSLNVEQTKYKTWTCKWIYRYIYNTSLLDKHLQSQLLCLLTHHFSISQHVSAPRAIIKWITNHFSYLQEDFVPQRIHCF